MKRLRVAIIGHGRLGCACVASVGETLDMTLAGVVVRGGEVAGLPPGARAVEHVRMLENVDAALVCVPAEQTLEVARELLQQGVPVVECARLEPHAMQSHHAGIGAAARHHRVPAVLSAGWDPGALTLLARLFEVLIPVGRTERDSRPGMTLHRAALPTAPGVRAARVCERRSADGREQRYVYAELERGTDPSAVEAAYRADPLFAGVETFVFAVPEVSALEPEVAGLVLQRYGAHAAGKHERLVLDARFAEMRFAAAVMLDAARALPRLAPGAHVYCSALGLAAVEH